VPIGEAIKDGGRELPIREVCSLEIIVRFWQETIREIVKFESRTIFFSY
jgi:hypothetical protein